MTLGEKGQRWVEAATTHLGAETHYSCNIIESLIINGQIGLIPGLDIKASHPDDASTIIIDMTPHKVDCKD